MILWIQRVGFTKFMENLFIHIYLVLFVDLNSCSINSAILKYTFQWYLVHSQCRATTTYIKFQIIFRKLRTHYPTKPRAGAPDRKSCSPALTHLCALFPSHPVPQSPPALTLLRSSPQSIMHSSTPAWASCPFLRSGVLKGGTFAPQGTFGNV